MRGGVRRFIDGHPFALALLIFIITSSNAFGASPQFVISGYVRTSFGVGVDSVSVVGDNGAGSAVTAADGAYSVTVPNHWSGKISVSKSGWLITPVSKTYNRVSANIANENYTAYQPKISGNAKKADGTALSGATVSVSGGTSTTTNASGYYEIIVPYGWSGTVSVSLAGYSFTAKNYTNVITDQTNQDFTGFQPVISGVITSYGAALEGVTLTCNNGGPTVATDSAGNYNLIVPYGWSGTITPSKPQYTFTPSQRSYSNVTNNTASQNYTAILPPVSISGYVRDSNGTEIAGVNVTVSNGGGSATTNSSGYYSVSVPYNWSGTATANKMKWQITPANYSYTNLSGDQVEQNFIATYLGIIVKPDGTGDYATIQAAIDVAITGDIILLQPGTYTGNGNRDIDFKGKAITVRGATGDPNTCIIDCQGDYINLHRGFNFVSGETADSVLESISIIKGYPPPQYIGYYDQWAGGGVLCINSSPTITKCIIRNSSAAFGGGIANYTSNPIISDCIVNNIQGAGIYNNSSSPIIRRCVISGASDSGIYNYYGSPIINECIVQYSSTLNRGGGIYLSMSNAIISNCVISNNSANTAGGGIYSYDNNTIITGCIIRNNHSSDNGGGIFIFNGKPAITSCVIAENSCSNAGGGIYVEEDKTSINNCTIVNNIAVSNGGIATHWGSPTISNSVIWGNQVGQIPPAMTAFYSDVEGGCSGSNNINIDPVLTSDYHLSPNSPCLNAGDPSCTFDPNVTDIDGDPRVIGRIEMGADEVCSAPGFIGLIPPTLSFAAQGLTSAPQSQQTLITNYGINPLNWQIVLPSDCLWLSATPNYGQLSTNQICGIQVSVDPSKAQYGLNTCQIAVFDANASNSPQMITVNLTVYGPSMYVNPPSMIVYAQTSGIVEKTFTIQNTGYDTMNWYIDEVNDCNWITAITPSSGQCPANEFDTVAVRINTQGLTDGVYEQPIIIHSPESTNSQAVFVIHLQVYTPNTIHVPTDYATIQQAVNAAQNGDTIIVHPGRYAGFISNKFLTIQSITPENRAIVAATIIESTANFSNREQSGGESTVNGLSFIFKQPGQQSYPFRGINFYGGDAIIKNCIIRNFPGAGISLINYSPYKARARIENCFITNNAFLYYQDYSGGIFTINYDIELRNSLISNNYSDGLVILSECIDFVKADITNCTIAENGSNHPAATASCITVPAYAFTDISIKNSILSGILDSNSPIIKINPTEQLINLNIDHSAIQGGQAAISAPNSVNIIWGQGNIESDPCFAKAGFLHDNNTLEYWDDYWIEGDYHLKSHAGRWKQSEFIYMDATGDGIMDMTDFAVLAGEWQTTSIPVSIPGSPYYYQPYLRADLDRNGIVDHNDLVLFCGNYGDYYDYGQWVFDDVNSPCIDAGNPNSDWSGELWPHGKRVNMGAYGNTAQASMSADKSGNTADLNKDGVVNLIDYARFSNNIEKPSLPLAEDINRDGFVDILDLCNLCENWLWMEGI